MRVEALVQKQMKIELKRNDEYQQFLQFRQYLRAEKAQVQIPPVVPSEKPDEALSGVSTLKTICAKCHGGAKQEGDLNVTLPLTPSIKSAIVGKVWRGEMPPPKKHAPLTAQQKADLLNELYMTIVLVDLVNPVEE